MPRPYTTPGQCSLASLHKRHPGPVPGFACAQPGLPNRRDALAEIGFEYSLIVAQVSAGATGDDRSGLQDIGATGGLERIARVLLDEQHACSGGIDRLDGAKDIAHDQRRETER